MNVSLLLTSLKIIQNHFRMALNWQAYGDNKIFILLLFIFIAPVLIYFSAYFGDQSRLNSQFASIFITLFVPLLVSKYYSKFLLKEKSFLKNYFSRKEIFIIHQMLVQFCSIVIFLFLILFGVIPHLNSIESHWLILIIVFLLFSYNLISPFLLKETAFSSTGEKSNRLWHNKIHSKKVLQVRAIFNRELLYNWRINKIYLLKGVISSLFFNAFLTLFIINNNYDDLFFIVVLLQYLLILSFIMQYPVVNDIQLCKYYLCTNYSVIIGQFMFFLILSTLYLILTITLFSIILVELNILMFSISFIGYLILLLYVLIVKQAYLNNHSARYLIYFMILIPITIPIVSINCIRRLKC
ncbi:MAG: hypothetical protein D8M61_18255 [Ignavibacteriae bacterium]|nr:hypothetical protein [Ignavibacteriota bacterium]